MTEDVQHRVIHSSQRLIIRTHLNNTWINAFNGANQPIYSLYVTDSSNTTTIVQQLTQLPPIQPPGLPVLRRKGVDEWTMYSSHQLILDTRMTPDNQQPNIVPYGRITWTPHDEW